MVRPVPKNCYKKSFCAKLILIFISSIILWQFYFTSKDLTLNHPYLTYDIIKEEPRDSSQSCLIPRHHPFDPSILQFIKKADPIDCRYLQPPLTFIDDYGILKINVTLLKKTFWYWSSITCKYCEVLRDNSNKRDFYLFNTSKSFTDFVDVSHADFIQVQCKNFFGITIYDFIHAHIRDNLLLDDNNEYKGRRRNASDKYNVLLFGIDSLSRLNAMRQLPKTFSYLKYHLHSFVLRGYFKVGGNTFPNIASMLTGYHPYEKPHVYFPLHKEMKPHDPWPFIWKDYSAEGYRTLFAEDFPEFNMFNYMAGGFHAQPTDHYLRTFWTAAESTMLHKFSSYLCYGNRPKHQWQIEYVKRYVTHLYDKVPFWGLSFLTEICHDYVNTVGAADDDLYSFVKFLNDEKYLENTIFVFFSDHGNRYSDLRETYIGAIEDKMPLFTIFLPEKFRTANPQAVINLEKNQARLTSAFDIYCMLMDILKVSSNSLHQVGNYKTLHGQSLFGEIPANRSCYEAGVSSEYCVCDEETEISIDDDVVKNIGQFLVEEINSLIVEKYKNFDLCSELVLKRVKGARLVGKLDEKTYKISFEAGPSGGIFEGTVRYSAINSTFENAGEIERINRYGNQPHCITDSILRVYCYCK